MSDKYHHEPQNKLSRILLKTKKNGDCLEWSGNYFKNGKAGWQYPYMYFKSKVWRGNRLVLFLSTGRMPNGMLALHTCDNNRCVNPRHLYWGTPKQNVNDAYSRGRARNAKVTHCPVGHEYSGKNLRIGKLDNKRYCRACAWYKSRKMNPQRELPECLK